MGQEPAKEHKKKGGMSLISDTPPMVSRIIVEKKRQMLLHPVFVEVADLNGIFVSVYDSDKGN